MRKIMLGLIFALLLIAGCKGVGEAIAQTRDKCCCRIVEPYDHQLVHFSVCAPPDYRIATDLGAGPEVDTDLRKCKQFCADVVQ